MGKGKKRKAAPAAAAPAREEPPNLFERLSNKKRFDILGRKVKGETRQLGKLRSAASERVSGVGSVAGRTATAWAPRSHWAVDHRSVACWSACCAAPIHRDLPHAVAACSARARCWWSTSSCAKQTPSLTGALEVGPGWAAAPSWQLAVLGRLGSRQRLARVCAEATPEATPHLKQQLTRTACLQRSRDLAWVGKPLSPLVCRFSRPMPTPTAVPSHSPNQRTTRA